MNLPNKLSLIRILLIPIIMIVYFIEPLNEIYELSPLIKNGVNSIKRVGEIYSIKINNNNFHKFTPLCEKPLAWTDHSVAECGEAVKIDTKITSGFCLKCTTKWR